MSYDEHSDDSSEEVPSAQPALSILFNLPEQHQATPVLRALICADEGGYQRAQRELAEEFKRARSKQWRRP